MLSALPTEGVGELVRAGWASDGVGTCFVQGYRAALRTLFVRPEPATLCVTEPAGGHPREIAATLVDGRVSGVKRWATLADSASWLFVLVSCGWQDGRNQLRVVRVRRSEVALTPMPPTPFTPEVPHFELSFQRVPVEEVLPGPGFDRWVRPFRTVEDIHVSAAVVGHLLRLCVEGDWDDAVLADLLSWAHSLSALGALDPVAPLTQIRLGAVQKGMNTLAQRQAQGGLESGLWQRWERDRALLRVAAGVRRRRLAQAVRALRLGG